MVQWRVKNEFESFNLPLIRKLEVPLSILVRGDEVIE
jgi:hypothetical protein